MFVAALQKRDDATLRMGIIPWCSFFACVPSAISKKKTMQNAHISNLTWHFPCNTIFCDENLASFYFLGSLLAVTKCLESIFFQL